MKKPSSKRHSHEIVRPAAPDIVPWYLLLELDRPGDGLGRHGWDEFVLFFLTGSLFNRFSRTGRFGTLTNRPALTINTTGTTAASLVFRTRYHDTNQVCWFNVGEVIGSISVSNIATP